MKRLLTTGLLAVLALPAFSGCNSLERNDNPVIRSSHLDRNTVSENDFSEPEGIAAIWTDSTLEQPGEVPVRGFGARIFFTDAADNPVKVDGELTVYGFEESNESDAADYKFVFRREELQSHYGENDIGHSYSIWIPWEPVGGVRKSVALIPVFKSSNGGIVRGEQSINVLPGRNPQTETAESSQSESGFTPIRTAGYESSTDSQGQVRTASHNEAPMDRVEAAPAAIAPSNASIRTTTIALPRHLANRMGDTNVFDAPGMQSGAGINRVQHSSSMPEQPAAEARSTSREEAAEPVRRTRGDYVFGKPGPRG
ncbi:MAG: hypothetical protein AAF456_22750 [Planctomycetota bacterium]